MPRNEAAWLLAKHQPLAVKEAPYPQPGAGEVVIRNRAVAVNPVDWLLQYMGTMIFAWLKYPLILGSDCAGDVVAVGSGVSEVKVGDRVLAMACGYAQQRNRTSEGGFQLYPIVLPQLTTVIPDRVSYAEAAVIPLGLITAACGLYQDDLLALERPSATPKPRDQWVIIWGGATSVGCNAIQLAAASGYGVVATASPKNFDYVKSLGATHVFDYHSRTVVRDIIAALKGKDVVGALTAGAGSASLCLDILSQCRGRKFIANCSGDISFGALPQGRGITLPALLRLGLARWLGARRTQRKSRRFGIPAKFYDASSAIDNGIGPAVFRDYLGSALADGRFRPAPPPNVIGTGLDQIQTALDTLRRGVSATKIVAALD